MSLHLEPVETPATPATRAERASSPRLVLGLRGGEAETIAVLTGAGLEVIATAKDGPALQAAVETHHPDIVLLHSHVPGVTPLMPEHFQRVAGAATILLVPASLRSSSADDKLAAVLRQPYPLALLADAERVGCLAVASWPPDLAELGMLIAQAVSVGRAAPRSGALVVVPPARAPASAGRVLAVRGSKGGVGKTEVVLAVALMLGLRGGRRVLLVDMDLAGPTVHRRLGLPTDPARGMDALYARLRGQPEGKDLDLRPYLAIYAPPAAQGAPATRETVDVLAGPTDPGVVEQLRGDEQALRALLAAARAAYDDVVLDLGNLSKDVPNPAHMLLAARADRVLVVTDSAPEAVEHTADGQARLQNATGLDTTRCSLVLNRLSTPRDLDLDALSEQCCGLRVVAVLPENRRLIERSRRQGRPWVLAEERSALCRATQALVNELTPGLLPDERGGLLDRLLGGTRRLFYMDEGR